MFKLRHQRFRHRGRNARLKLLFNLPPFLIAGAIDLSQLARRALNLTPELDVYRILGDVAFRQ